MENPTDRSIVKVRSECNLGGNSSQEGNSEIAQSQAIHQDTKYKIHDNDVIVKEPDEVYVLSEDFWSVFRDRYGCDI